MEESLEKLMNVSLRKKRNPSCTLCKNHGMRSNLKGHKWLCPFSKCDCEPCVKGRKRRVVMSEQVRLRRKQMKDIGSRCNSFTPVEPFRVDFSLAVAKTGSNLPTINEHRSFEEDKKLAVMNHSGRNGGLIQSMSNIFHSQFSAPRQQSFNCSANMPTPYQLQWNTRDLFSGFHSYNNWPPEHVQPLSSSPIKLPTSPGFTVSDNSAFVKYCGYSPRTESNSCRFGHSSPTEVATLLTSFGSSEQGTPKH